MLEIGNIAPNFKLPDADGRTHELASYKGKKVILYFYPKDDTPGCTKEACNLRDNYSLLTQQNYVILGISADGQQSHQKFIQKYQLPFILLSDENKEVIKTYDAWGTKNLYGKVTEGIIRKTFVIDENGIITDIIKKVDTEKHTEQILERASKKIV